MRPFSLTSLQKIWRDATLWPVLFLNTLCRLWLLALFRRSSLSLCATLTGDPETRTWLCRAFVRGDRLRSWSLATLRCLAPHLLELISGNSANILAHLKFILICLIRAYWLISLCRAVQNLETVLSKIILNPPINLLNFISNNSMGFWGFVIRRES